ncbi:TetR/AcrR family transcriptional regulator [Conexibacter woesei]|uniref:TetR/AcrR family transcriptional regulator n=1 Tax=Conexibacter woesei TaxID=191495 RepID=UPI00041AD226|nr:TetR/AcrR family transcriptional regulator [Conexibacter woesei]
MTENGKSSTPTATSAAGSSTRERLVQAAQDMIWREGIERTSIADVARAAGVPSGNVYYHFKTKDDLVEAAMAARVREQQEFLAHVSRRRSPQAQLKAFARELMHDEDGSLTALYGCPFGSLVSEFGKRDDPLSRRAGEVLLAPFIDWAEERFAAMGQRDPRELAITLFATYQGAALLSNAFHDPSIMAKQARRLERWITSLDKSTGSGSPIPAG